MGSEVAPRLRVSARALSSVGRTIGLGRWVPLDEDWVLEQAKRRTGLSDFGDEGFREPLRLLLAELDRHDPHLIGRWGALELFTRAVETRLRQRALLVADPGVGALHVARPIYVLGLHGSGASLVHRLLATLPGIRGLALWEQHDPVPPAEGEVDRRRKRAEEWLRVGRWLAPEMDQVHPSAVDEPDTCWPLFLPTFAVGTFALQHDLPEYGAWLFDHDMRGVYAWVANSLRIRLREGPRQQLVLHGADHLWFLDALLATFSDARIVWVHRDPITCAAVCATVASLNRRTLLGQVDPATVGPHVAEGYQLGLWRAMAARKPGDPRFVDLHHAEVAADPIGVTRRLAQSLDLGWDEEYQRVIAGWLAEHPLETWGPPPVPASTFGLDRRIWSGRFATYRTRFDVSEDR